MAEPRVVLVRLYDLERTTGYYSAATIPIEAGQHCVVSQSGPRLGLVVSCLEMGDALDRHLDRVLRVATQGDLEAHRRNRERTEEVLSATREMVARQKLPMHLVAADYALDRSQLRVYFTAPHRVDFRELLREMGSRFHARIELRQMGARDEARLKGGVGRCGRIICCHGFLHQPRPIPMELAYDQELFVPPERITGVCGRLMCCLAYEHEAYKRELAKMPKLGARATVGNRKGKIIAHNILRRTVTLLVDDKERVEVDAAAVKTVS
ncbi:MAG: stage 0 sporulation protein [Candidatus Bipolaricaulota bacterium]|nr:MAG: stage 0 sporulation protein [Candidatus Bipolaricaulota bacterium]